MTSLVGTILYWCPEIIKNEPYSDKADVWALGCLLYQMATLEPPFTSTNMLTLATKIVDANFEAIPDESGYSELVTQTVRSCLTPDSSQRPDIVRVCGLVAEPMMRYTDNLVGMHMKAEKLLEKERKRTQRHFYEARRNKQDYQTLFQASQETNGGRSSSRTIDSASPRPSTRSNSEEADVFLFCSVTPPKHRPCRPSSGGVRTSSKRPSSAGIRVQSNAVQEINTPRRALSFEQSTTSQSIQSTTGRSILSARGRPPSGGPASRMLSISPSKVREIDDPVTKTLMQLHKIIYIDQLPPTSEVNYRRRIISRYKRVLFTPNNRADMLKIELSKLLSGSHDVIDISFVVDATMTHSITTKQPQEGGSGDNCYNYRANEFADLVEEGITYSQMKIMIEKVLHESGYYEVSNKPLRFYKDFMPR